jgi:hypothetical protein
VYREQLGAEPPRHLTGKIKGFVGVIGAIERDQNSLDHRILLSTRPPRTPQSDHGLVSGAARNRESVEPSAAGSSD